MGIFDAIDSAKGGLHINRIRMNVSSSNVANTYTTKTENGTPYKRKEVVVSSYTSFSKILDSKLSKPDRIDIRIREDDRNFKLVYDPTHPDADKNGYLSLPNINVVEEMVDMLNASRGFELNSLVIQMAKQMAMNAISIAEK